VHAHIDDKALVDRGLTNYWGYNTIGFFAPGRKYSGSGDRGGQVNEFKPWCATVHAAGIESSRRRLQSHRRRQITSGTLLFAGIDNSALLRLRTEKSARFLSRLHRYWYTFNLLHPRTLQLVMDSLRYWVLEMHVDGFRFDLRQHLARDANGVNKLHAFFENHSPGPGAFAGKINRRTVGCRRRGYQVGNFPVL